MKINTFNTEIQSNRFGFLQLEKREQVALDHEPEKKRLNSYLKDVDCLSTVSTFKVIQRFTLILSRVQCVYIQGRMWLDRPKLIPAKLNHFSLLK